MNSFSNSTINKTGILNQMDSESLGSMQDMQASQNTIKKLQINNIMQTAQKNNEQNMEKSPFVGRAALKRTPPMIPGPKTKNKEPQADNVSNTPTSTQSGGTFLLLGDLIVDLMEYVKERNNVHHAIRDKIRKIRITYNKVRDERENDTSQQASSKAVQTSPNSNRKHAASQTSPKVRPNIRESKRSRDSSDVRSSTEMPKRQKKSAPNERDSVRSQKNPTEKVEKKDMSKRGTTSYSAVIKRQITKSAHPEQNVSSDEPQTDTELLRKDAWKTVKRAKKKRPKKPKPDAILISTKGETSYADILRKLKADPELKGLGDEVKKIRRTQKGDLLLELKGTNVADKFNVQVSTSLSGCANVMTRMQETIIECKDLDDITTEAEICLALAQALNLPKLDEGVVKSLRKTPIGTQTAKISLPTKTAYEALKLRRIKIGWSMCHLKETRTVIKCFKCLDYGHTSRSCKAEIDRSNQCRRCGEEGHLAKNCQSEANCILCKLKGSKDLRHITGSYKCPVFRKALSESNKCE